MLATFNNSIHGQDWVSLYESDDIRDIKFCWFRRFWKNKKQKNKRISKHLAKLTFFNLSHSSNQTHPGIIDEFCNVCLPLNALCLFRYCHIEAHWYRKLIALKTTVFLQLLTFVLWMSSMLDTTDSSALDTCVKTSRRYHWKDAFCLVVGLE